MNEDQYWEAQAIICKLEEHRQRKMMTNTEVECLDLLLSLRRP